MPPVFGSSSVRNEIEIMLDGVPLQVPAERRSLSAIRSYLDTLALEQQRLLCSFVVDGEPISPSHPHEPQRQFVRIHAQTIDLDDLPAEAIRMALEQTAKARSSVIDLIDLVLINEGCVARELWWNLARELNRPLLTLGFITQPLSSQPEGCASLPQLRKWQLQQLAAIIREVDEACWKENPWTLSNALEHRVLPWLENLQSCLELWRETLLAGVRAHAPARM